MKDSNHATVKALQKVGGSVSTTNILDVLRKLGSRSHIAPNTGTVEGGNVVCTVKFDVSCMRWRMWKKRMWQKNASGDSVD